MTSEGAYYYMYSLRAEEQFHLSPMTDKKKIAMNQIIDLFNDYETKFRKLGYPVLILDIKIVNQPTGTLNWCRATGSAKTTIAQMIVDGGLVGLNASYDSHNIIDLCNKIIDQCKT